MRHNMRSQNLIDVTGSCYSIASLRAKILEDNWTKFHVESDVTPTIMPGPPQAFLSIMQLSSYRSSRLLHNLVLPSERMTLCHCWLCQFCRCNAHWTRSCRCRGVKTGPLAGRWHLRLLATNRRRTVSALIGRWCVPTVCYAVSVALVNRFHKCWRTINLFWRGVITCGLPLHGRSFVLFVAL